MSFARLFIYNIVICLVYRLGGFMVVRILSRVSGEVGAQKVRASTKRYKIAL